MANFSKTCDSLSLLSIHWGFSLGGVGKYATVIERVSEIAPIYIKSAIILGKKWQTDIEGIEKLNANKILIKSRFDFSWIKKTMAIIKSERPDLIMSHGLNGHFANLLTKSITRHKIPFICSYHGRYYAPTPVRKALESPYNVFAEYFIRHKATDVVTVSQYTKNYLIDKSVPDDKISVIHNGITDVKAEPKVRGRLRDEWEIADCEMLIGVVSRLDPIKGIEYLIDAFSALSNEYSNLKLAIIGDGPIAAYLEKKIYKLGLSEKVIFTGFRSDIVDCLNAIDIFVLPSLAENHSIAILEAMRAGKAIVATDVGGNTESVRHGKEGLIVPPADAKGLAQAIDSLINNPSFFRTLARAAYERFFNEFTEEKMIQETAFWIMKCGKKARCVE